MEPIREEDEDDILHTDLWQENQLAQSSCADGRIATSSLPPLQELGEHRTSLLEATLAALSLVIEEWSI